MSLHCFLRPSVASFVLLLALNFSLPAWGEAAGQDSSPGFPTALVVPQDITTPHPLLSDPEMRRALAQCTDKAALVKSVYPYLTTVQAELLVMDSFLPATHPYYQEPPAGFPDFDPVAAGQLLDSNGWFLSGNGEYRRNADNYELTVGATFLRSQSYQALEEELTQQWLEHCGARLLPYYEPSNVLMQSSQSGSLAQRAFEIAGFPWTAHPFPVGRFYRCASVPEEENGLSGFNIIGWCNPAVDQAIGSITLLADASVVQNAYGTVQAEFAKDVPSLPLFQQLVIYSANPGLQNYAPQPIDRDTWNAHEWIMPGTTTLVIRSSQEPQNLFNDPSPAHQRVKGLIHDPAVVYDGYVPKPNRVTILPTLKSGISMTATVVTVREGSMVYDANGQLVTLEPGVGLILADGTYHVYMGGPVELKAYHVDFFSLPTSFFEDEPVSSEDYELGHEVFCVNQPPDDSACDAFANVEFADNGYTITYVPGFMFHDNPLFIEYGIVPPFDVYPAHQIIATPGEHQGKRLGDVPIEDWETLPEVTETPLTTGPYFVRSWMRGERMVLEPNPHYRKGPVNFEQIIIRFDLSGAEAYQGLLDGTVHVSDGIAASTTPSLTVYHVSSPNWEHLDFNFHLYDHTVSRVLPATGGTVSNAMGISVTVPDGATTDTVTVIVDYLPRPPHSLVGIATPIKSLEVTILDSGEVTVSTTLQPIEIQLHYEDVDVLNVDENLLNVQQWDGTKWAAILPCDGCSINPDENLVTFQTSALTEYALVDRSSVYMPILLKK